MEPLAAFAAISKAIDIAKNLTLLKGPAERNAGLAELQKLLIDAHGVAMSLQNQNASLLDRNQELEQEVVRLKDWSQQRALYALRQIGQGAFAYVAHTAVQSVRDVEKLCPKCFGEDKIGILSTEQEFPDVILQCTNGCRPMKFVHFV